METRLCCVSSRQSLAVAADSSIPPRLSASNALDGRTQAVSEGPTWTAFEKAICTLLYPQNLTRTSVSNKCPCTAVGRDCPPRELAAPQGKASFSDRMTAEAQGKGIVSLVVFLLTRLSARGASPGRAGSAPGSARCRGCRASRRCRRSGPRRKLRACPGSLRAKHGGVGNRRSRTETIGGAVDALASAPRQQHQCREGQHAAAFFEQRTARSALIGAI